MEVAEWQHGERHQKVNGCAIQKPAQHRMPGEHGKVSADNRVGCCNGESNAVMQGEPEWDSGALAKCLGPDQCACNGLEDKLWFVPRVAANISAAQRSMEPVMIPAQSMTTGNEWLGVVGDISPSDSMKTE